MREVCTVASKAMRALVKRVGTRESSFETGTTFPEGKSGDATRRTVKVMAYCWILPLAQVAGAHETPMN